MKFVFPMAVGMVLGLGAAALVIYLKEVPAPENPAAMAPIQSAVEATLRVEYEKAQGEIRTLKKLLSTLGKLSTPASGNPPAAAPEAPAAAADSEPEDRTLEDRQVSVRESLDLLEKDGRLKEIYRHFMDEENSYPNWTSAQFLQDARVNAGGEKLSPEERRQFDFLFAHAFERIKILDLHRQLRMSEAIVRKLEVDGAAGASNPAGVEPGGQAVSLPGNLQVSLTAQEAQEINLLNDEKNAAVVEWLIEAQRFLSPGK